MDNPVVRIAGKADEASVLSVITLAFSTDPIARWVLPNAETYLANMPKGARAFGGNGLAHDSVYMGEGGLGAAMWLPPGISPDMETLQEVMGANAPPTILPDLEKVFEQMDRYHPTEPHWYLPIIGVDPSSHGKGLGSALMQRALERSDSEGVPAYLESIQPAKHQPLQTTRLRGIGEDSGRLIAGCRSDASPPSKGLAIRSVVSTGRVRHSPGGTHDQAIYLCHGTRNACLASRRRPPS